MGLIIQQLHEQNFDAFISCKYLKCQIEKKSGILE
jgi:hypothetical protein